MPDTFSSQPPRPNLGQGSNGRPVVGEMRSTIRPPQPPQPPRREGVGMMGQQPSPQRGGSSTMVIIIVIVIVLLLLVAGFILWRRSQTPQASPLPTQGQLQIPVENPDADDDNDGLTNGDEAIWRTDRNNPDTDNDGFTDGEEVAAGHHPRFKAPDKLIPGYDPTKQYFQEITPSES